MGENWSKPPTAFVAFLAFLALVFADAFPSIFVLLVLGSIGMGAWVVHANEKRRKQTGEEEVYLSNVFAFLMMILAIPMLLHGPVVHHRYDGRIRSKLSWTKADLRSLGMALEDYYNDHQAYPNVIEPLLTTPVAYIQGGFALDPFLSRKSTFVYRAGDQTWLLISAGPDQLIFDSWSAEQMVESLRNMDELAPFQYDPTNGIESGGDIFWSRTAQVGRR